jgi:hypothetical protein
VKSVPKRVVETEPRGGWKGAETFYEVNAGGFYEVKAGGFYEVKAKMVLKKHRTRPISESDTSEQKTTVDKNNPNIHFLKTKHQNGKSN